MLGFDSEVRNIFLILQYTNCTVCLSTIYQVLKTYDKIAKRNKA